MRISDWSSDVCSSDLPAFPGGGFWGALAHRQKAVSGSSRRCSGNAAAGIFIDAASGHVDDGLCHDGAFCAEHGLARPVPEIGRASCRERVCQYVSISVVAVSLKKKHMYKYREMRLRAYDELQLFNRMYIVLCPVTN